MHDMSHDDRLSRLGTRHQRDTLTDSHVAIANAAPTHCVVRQKRRHEYTITSHRSSPCLSLSPLPAKRYIAPTWSPAGIDVWRWLLPFIKEEEENLFAKKTGCQKGLQPINAGYHTHIKTKIHQIYTNITCRTN